MTYDEKIPEFALQPAKEAEEPAEQKQNDDGFDPTPYDRLLVPLEETEAEPLVFKEDDVKVKETAEPADPAKLTPLSASSVYNELKITEVSQKLKTNVFVEEDILVPDIKPDLVSVLAMDGKAYLSNKEFQVGKGEEDGIRITGELLIQTIYLPQQAENGETVSIIQSRLPFKTDWQVSASPMSHLCVTPEIEKIEFSVINERKFRAKITLSLILKEYAEKELQLFESLRNEKLELLKETIAISHIAFRKEESAEISEDLKLKENSLRPVKILKFDVRAIENHKQVTSEKIVVNANIWVSILYLAEDEDDSRKIEFFQTKTDFTQFMLAEHAGSDAICNLSFDSKDLEVKINEEEDGFDLNGSIRTAAEVYRSMEREIVTDFYHNTKDLTCDFAENNAETLVASRTAEASAREIFNIPDHLGQAGSVIYVNGFIKEQKSFVEPGRVNVEGILEGQILCLSDREEGRPFSVKQDIPFRSSIDIPEASQDMKAESKAVIKELWFDKINSKQVEVNASIQVETAVIKETRIPLIKNPCFIDHKKKDRSACMVLYIARKGDRIWNIAKKYKISTDVVRKINQMDDKEEVSEGMRLLIVK